LEEGTLPDEQRVAIVDAAGGAGSTAALLEQAGFKVRTFDGGGSFLAALHPGNIDCVVLDMGRGGRDGIALMEALSSWEIIPPVLVLTGRGAIADAVQAMKLGAVDFLEKPYPADSFLEAVARALKKGPGGKADAHDSEALAKLGALTQRQEQVLRGVVSGQPNKIIAYNLSLSIRTVEAYRSQLLHKLGVRGTAEAVRLAIAAGMI
jgi:two-component system response regulator FixJ